MAAPRGTLLIEHGLYGVGANTPGVPLFDGNGSMLTPGRNYPIVNGAGALNGAVLTGRNPTLGLTTLPGGRFGGATTTLLALSFGFGSGLFWPSYFVRDPIAGDAFNFYNVSGGDVSFRNGFFALGGQRMFSFHSEAELSARTLA